MRFEVKRANGKQGWYFRIVAENNRVLAHSENYASRRNALHAIDVIHDDICDGLASIEIEQ